MAFSKDLREIVISEDILGVWAGFPKAGVGAQNADNRQVREGGNGIKCSSVQLAEGRGLVLEF